MPKFLRFYLVLWVINVGDVGVFFDHRVLPGRARDGLGIRRPGPTVRIGKSVRRGKRYEYSGLVCGRCPLSRSDYILRACRPADTARQGRRSALYLQNGGR